MSLEFFGGYNDEVVKRIKFFVISYFWNILFTIIFSLVSFFDGSIKCFMLI